MSTCVLCSATVDVAAALLWRKGGHDIVRCPSCGLVFRADPPTAQELAGIYDEGYFRDSPDGTNRHGYADYVRDAPMHRANARRRLRLLAAYKPDAGRVLDVGCAAGFFVDEARRAGWDASGIDVSPPMVDWARAELDAPVVCASFEQAAIEPPELDAITMWDYIEHSIDPRRDVARAAEHLPAGGILALSTGDIGALSARVAGRRWHLLTPEHHNFFFDRRMLARLLEEHGFDVVDARRRSSLYSAGHVLYKTGSLVPVAAIRRGAARIGRSRLGSVGIPLNLYDIVTVLARRR